MRLRTLSLLCSLLAGCAAACHGQNAPVLTGYVTRAVSASDFDVNGFRILCRAKLGSDSKPIGDEKVAVVNCPGEAPNVGDMLAIQYTQSDTRINAVYATRIDKQRTSRFGEVSGSAVIDAAPTEEAAGGQQPGLTVRADGFRIRITAKTRIEWNPPLQSLADVKAGIWIRYKGKLNAAGVLLAASAQIGPNALGGREEKLRAKNEYDPSAVPADARQNYLKDAITVGLDAKKFPPYKDEEMQARIEKVGSSLVPAYQRALPASDPAKFEFRFQLIDTKLLAEALALPNGIILVPRQVVERLQSGSQLAAVLADGIACVIERQQYRTEGKIKAAYASEVAAAIVPYAGFGMLVSGGSPMDIERREREQRDRVSIALMHDAGYDIVQAPMAWWDPAKRASPDTDIPERVAYLYRILGAVWSHPAGSASAAE